LFHFIRSTIDVINQFVVGAHGDVAHTCSRAEHHDSIYCASAAKTACDGAYIRATVCALRHAADHDERRWTAARSKERNALANGPISRSKCDAFREREACARFQVAASSGRCRDVHVWTNDRVGRARFTVDNSTVPYESAADEPPPAMANGGRHPVAGVVTRCIPATSAGRGTHERRTRASPGDSSVSEPAGFG
jgi:hypothetical protein